MGAVQLAAAVVAKQSWLSSGLLFVHDATQGEYRRAHEVKLSTDALYETELAATHQAWELVVELKKNKLITKQQGEQHDSRSGLKSSCQAQPSEPCSKTPGKVTDRCRSMVAAPTIH